VQIRGSAPPGFDISIDRLRLLLGQTDMRPELSVSDAVIVRPQREIDFFVRQRKVKIIQPLCHAVRVDGRARIAYIVG
jgi:hypothetical protein